MPSTAENLNVHMWADEYDGRIKEFFLGNSVIFLQSHHGLVNDSFQLRLWSWSCSFTFDLNLVYRANDTATSSYHTMNRKFT